MCRTLPSSTRVEKLYEEARARIEVAAQTAARFGRSAPSEEEVQAVQDRLRSAYWALRTAGARRVRHQRLRIGTDGTELPTPVTNRVRCPTDVSALTLHAIVWCIDGVPIGGARISAPTY